MTTANPAVLVVGAGPAGLAHALVLSQNGVNVRIIEKATEWHDSQRGSGIQPRTLELFHFLGALPEMRKIGSSSPALHIYPRAASEDAPYRVMDMVDPAMPTPDKPMVESLMIGQNRYTAILRDMLVARGVQVELGTELVGLEQDADGVTAHITKGSEREDLRVQYLVGADGGRGITHRLIPLTYTGKPEVEQGFVVADAEVKGIDRESWRVWGKMDEAAVMLRPTEPDRPQRFQLFIGGPNILVGDGEGEVKEGLPHWAPSELVADHSKLVDAVKVTTGRNELDIKILWAGIYKPRIRMADTFQHGRVLVAGDAAHVHSATGGQGTNSSVQDAVNLGWKLSLVVKGLARATLLESYSAERTPVIAEMLELTTGLYHSMRKDAFEISLRRGGVLQMFGVHCRWSAIVRDWRIPAGSEEKATPTAPYTGVGGLRAGDRAPDAPGLMYEADVNGTRLFDLFKPTRHTALVFPGADVDVGPFLSALAAWPKETLLTAVVLPKDSKLPDLLPPADLVLSDGGGHAHAGYEVPSDGGAYAVVVRPDGYIGAYVRDAAELLKYKEGIFGSE